jgi:hypothetical protein
MSEQRSRCPRCGTALSPGAKFCPGCGEQNPASAPGGQGSLQKAAEAVQAVSSTVSKVESTVRSAGTVARTARDLSTITIRPPAQWKVVVGEILPVAGKKAVDAAVSTAGQKVTGEVSRVVTEHLRDASQTSVPESFVPHQAPPGATSGMLCPACGKPLIPGNTFCGSCGARIDEERKPAPALSPVCPSCGKPVITGKKFCGSCGAKIGETAKPVSAPPLQPVCPSCGRPVGPGKKFCGSCGAKIGETAKPVSAPPLQPVCPACGKPVIPGKKFCGSCGHRLA